MKKLIVWCLVASLCFSCNACGAAENTAAEDTVGEDTIETGEDTASALGAKAENKGGQFAGGAVQAEALSAEDLPTAEEVFSDRDYEVGYADYTTITLKDGATESSDAGVTVAEDSVTITAEGTYLLTGTLSNGQIIVEVSDTEKVQLVLDNASVTCEGSAVVYIKSGDKVFITTTKDSSNTLATVGEFVQTDDNTVDGAIFSKADLTLNGEGSLQILCETAHGIVSKDDLKITSGSYEISSAKKALSGKDCVAIAGGDIVVPECSEGMESLYIYIFGGTIKVNASDDGMNATDTVGDNAAPLLFLAGGKVELTAKGDGIDTNGNFYMAGGELYINGPESAGNGILDYDFSGCAAGGTFVGVGVSGMQQNFDSNSTQGSILYTLSAMQQAGSIVTLADAEGKILASFQTGEAYQVVIISTPEIEVGETYTLTAGEETAEIEMTELIYGAGNGMGGFSGGQGGHKGGRKDGTFTEGEMGTPPEGMAMPEGEMGTPPEGLSIPEGEMGTPPEGMDIPEGEMGTPPEGMTMPENS